MVYSLFALVADDFAVREKILLAGGRWLVQVWYERKVPAGADIRRYPTRLTRIWAAVFARGRGHGHGHKISPAARHGHKTSPVGAACYPHTTQDPLKYNNI